MSRSGYVDDDWDYGAQWRLIRWRGAVKSAINGKRGQSFLRELADSLDAMGKKELIAEELEADGSYCTLGVIGKCRGIDLDKIDPNDRDEVGRKFGIAPAMAAEIVYENDEAGVFKETPSQRWIRVRQWVASKIAT